MHRNHRLFTIKHIMQYDQDLIHHESFKMYVPDFLKQFVINRLDLYLQILQGPERAVARYSRMWQRMKDLDIDISPFVEVEKGFFAKVGLQGKTASISDLLRQMKGLLHSAATQSLNSRECTYIFHGRVSHRGRDWIPSTAKFPK